MSEILGGGVGPSVRKCEKGGGENPPKQSEIIFERSLTLSFIVLYHIY